MDKKHSLVTKKISNDKFLQGIKKDGSRVILDKFLSKNHQWEIREPFH
jgi:hypothetical protein|tara:strand:- start:1072 stop:1215 length:144 start_codon:yes stop_codon:yes gene_type:complete